MGPWKKLNYVPWILIIQLVFDTLLWRWINVNDVDSRTSCTKWVDVQHRTLIQRRSNSFMFREYTWLITWLQGMLSSGTVQKSQPIVQHILPKVLKSGICHLLKWQIPLFNTYDTTLYQRWVMVINDVDSTLEQHQRAYMSIYPIWQHQVPRGKTYSSHVTHMGNTWSKHSTLKVLNRAKKAVVSLSVCPLE